MPQEYPYRCTRCGKTVYAPSKRFAECCKGAQVLELVNMCYMISQNSAPTHTVVHIVPDNTPLPAANGAKCVTACNATTKPKFSASHISAVTCKKCLEWVESRKSARTIESERNYILSQLDGVEFVDESEPAQSFKSKVEEVKKIDTSLSDFGDVQEILAKLKSLHENDYFRKIVKQRKSLLQELRTK